MEKPFTGKYIDLDSVGIYKCSCCQSSLFLSEHKHPTESGYATFWTCLDNTVTFEPDRKVKTRNENVLNHMYNHQDPEYTAVSCSSCKGFLGVVYKDGLPPHHLRFTINSVALDFIDRPYFENPNFIRNRKKAEKASKKKTTRMTLMNRQPFIPEELKLATETQEEETST